MMKILLIIFLILSVFYSDIYSQNRPSEDLKAKAQELMKAGRYGEAIETLNRFISANPQNADGLNLRALCYENRGNFEMAVYDLRTALKIAPNNKEIQQNLSRVTDKWYTQIYNSIEGYKREIAINPAVPKNYLEIGKNYKRLGEWLEAEKWYDEYLKREDPSADELIRYTEILAKNNHIQKGEPWLKKYTEKYPTDHRLWSRYGYFLHWLGKNKLAEQAFLKALELRPFFKEALDGLDLVRGKGLIYQVNDTTKRRAQDLIPKERVYAIDYYYRLLRNDPQNDEARFKLVEELIKEERLEEAYQQLQVLRQEYKGTKRFDDNWNYVNDYRDKIYQQKIDQAKKTLESNPTDINAVKIASQYYAYQEDYINAISVIEKYYELVPNDNDPELKFNYARYLAWDRDFDKSIEIMDELLKQYPGNIDYQMFRAQLSIWTDRDLDLADEYLTNVLRVRPKYVPALISMGTLRAYQKRFDEAQTFVDRAVVLEPANPDIAALQSNIDLLKLRAEEEENYKILEQGRQLALAGDCLNAIQYYEEYKQRVEPSILFYKEFGDILYCAEQYDKAIEAYNNALAQGDYFDAELQRAKVYYSMRDSISAVKAFEDLVKKEPDNFEANLYLGDSYALYGDADKAEKIYDKLLEWELDTAQVSLVKMRYKWLPRGSSSSLFQTLLSYVGISPSIAFYTDNIGFNFLNYGGRVEVGLISIFSAGISFYRTNIFTSVNGDLDFNTFKGHLYFNYKSKLSGGVGLGRTTIGGYLRKPARDAFLRYDEKNKFYVAGIYNYADGSLLLYSPYLLWNRFPTSIYRLEGEYNFDFGVYVYSHFQYVEVKPEFTIIPPITDLYFRNELTYGKNKGNDFQFRIGRYFTENVLAGYEYHYQNFRYRSNLYYTPREFESHSIWADWYVIKDSTTEFKAIGKLGYVPLNDFIIMQGGLSFKYNLRDNLQLYIYGLAGKTSRDEVAYRFLSLYASLFWTL
ncbi:MAG: tetratricopeptide repeat protein [Ignavibacterium sp.]|nr:tetratricopeptide repeat protein [Ignavibacterium sp.]MDW8374367.1 tetratricopeptide repeat protein [Ignavibacteriales bacterium]